MYKQTPIPSSFLTAPRGLRLNETRGSRHEKRADIFNGGSETVTRAEFIRDKLEEIIKRFVQCETYTFITILTQQLYCK